MKIAPLSIATVFCLAVAQVAPALAEPTDVTIRVMSRDAKFIGTSMGGAQITVFDAKTGEILAEGKTAGETGDTARIMKQGNARRETLSTEGAAKFSVTLDLTEPRLIEVVAEGPLSNPKNANRISATQWVIPGKHLTGGDGWVLEMPGFVVAVQPPPAEVKLGGKPQTVTLNTKVQLMCGCPIEPEGLWDANDYEVKALVTRDGKPVGETVLTFAGKTSQFAGTFTVDTPGVYEAVVYAYAPANGNTGLDRVTFAVSR